MKFYIVWANNCFPECETPADTRPVKSLINSKLGGRSDDCVQCSVYYCVLHNSIYKVL